MKTIEATAVVSAEGTLTMRVPRDIQLGQHQVVLVIEEEIVGEAKAQSFDFSVDHCGAWPENLSRRREDMYGDWGR